ncbi:hypothetical protein E4634_18765 [Mangrovimicrobium sediminis]|uniref:Uncharacterized protein n=1 Tax=Mangrovimicrobium sediminis TaxID=2562682 RepID=A0A4Z0LW65_9GAMM|nr:hypothetical protein [Haliea sp. SAOS-164]TGD71315.1 hypothetical protein E4634_18765 [Haliea sp. SAOS-164]
MDFFSRTARPTIIKNWLYIVFAAGMSILLVACGSTKVYTAEKTLVYNGSLYNLGQVQQISSKLIAELPNGEIIDPGKMDSKAIKSLIKEHDSFTLSTVFLLDEKEVVYERATIDSYSDYTKRVKSFDSAKKKVGKFMSDAKSTQLKLD